MRLPLVLVNGWGMARATWQPLMDAWGTQRACTAVDLDGLTATGEVEALAANTARHAPERCDVIAWSLGAQVALQWAHDCPGQVRALALIAATPRFVARDGALAGMDPGVFDAFARDVDGDPAAALGRFALLQARGDARAGAVGRALRAALCDAGRAGERLRSGLACLRATDLRGVAAHVPQPVLLLHGTRDEIVPVAAAQDLARRLPDARLNVFDGAAHAPHVSRPEAVAAALREFFR